MADDVDKEARKIVKESLELEDHGPSEAVDDGCTRCGDDATGQDQIGSGLYYEEHATEHFTERHR